MYNDSMHTLVARHALTTLKMFHTVFHSIGASASPYIITCERKVLSPNFIL